MNYIAQRDVLKQLGISISTLKRWQNTGVDLISVSETVKIYDQSAVKIGLSQTVAELNLF